MIYNPSNQTLLTCALSAYTYNYISETVFTFLVIETKSLSERIGKLMSYLKGTDMKGHKFK